MNKEIVQSLWIDNVLGEHQKACIQSFLRNDVDYHLYTYGDVDNLPNGVKIKDANEIVSKDKVFKDLFESYATFSDWFRVKLLYELGGWWVDADMLCVRAFDIDSPYVFATENIRRNERKVVNICNCVLKMPKGSEMGRNMLDIIELAIRLEDPKSIKWTSIGAKIIKEQIFEMGMFDYIVSPEVFCPFDYLDYTLIFDKASIELSEITYGIHLWNKMWEWSKKTPLEYMDKDSFFSRYIKL